MLSGLVSTLPALAPELRTVMEMLDAGEALVVDGIGDPLARAGLRALCASLGMSEVEVTSGDDGDEQPSNGYEAPAHLREAGIVAHLGPVLDGALKRSSASSEAGSNSSASDEKDAGSADASASLSSSKRVIGPARPTEAMLNGEVPDSNEGDDDSDDSDVGPLLPNDPRAQRRALKAEEARQAQRAAQNEADAAAAAAHARRTGKSDGGHEAWMSLPSEELFGGKPKGPGNQYATKAAPNAGIGWKYLAPSAKEDKKASSNSSAASGGGSGSRSFMDQVAAARGGSLVEQYQSAAAKGAPAAATAGTAAACGAAKAERRPFDRDRDLQRPRMAADPSKIIENAGALASRFGSGRFDRTFM